MTEKQMYRANQIQEQLATAKAQLSYLSEGLDDLDNDFEGCELIVFSPCGSRKHTTISKIGKGELNEFVAAIIAKRRSEIQGLIDELNVEFEAL